MEALFDDRRLGTSRASAQVCLPRLPGPFDSSIGIGQGKQYKEQGSASQASNDNLHQGDTHSARSSESFDLPSITR